MAGFEQEERPLGTIVRRIIRGKERFYHQWRENGKTMNRYLKADEVLPLREKIEQRKALLAKSPRKPYSCAVLTGERLAELASSVRPLKPHSVVRQIVHFLKAPASGHSLLVRGLPQTGKTTLLRQAIGALDAEERKTCAYLSVPLGLSIPDFLTDLHTLSAQGLTRILIDGLDRVLSLEAIFQPIEDVFSATGMRLILTASTSRDIQVPARTEIVSTTFLSLADYFVETEDGSLADYLTCGGPTAEQLDERSLTALAALNRRILLRVLTETTRRHAPWSARLGTDIQKLVRRLGESLGNELSEADLARLHSLDLVATADDETVMILPGLRHDLSQRLVRELLSDDIAAHLGAAERKIVEDTILNLVTDRTLADLVLYKMMKTRKNETTDVFRVRFPSGGFDVVVADRDELTCELYEVRNTADRTDAQLTNLTDPDMLDTLEHRYGTIVCRTLVYNGRNAWHTSGIAYRKSTAFL